MSVRSSWLLAGLLLPLGSTACVVQTGSSVPAASPAPAAHASGAEVASEQAPLVEPAPETQITAPVQGPIQCSDNQDVPLDGVRIDAGEGVAVDASGNCDVVLRNCVLSGAVAVRVSGNGDVRLENCRIEGHPTAYLVDGNGTLTLVGTTVEGEKSVSGNGDVVVQ